MIAERRLESVLVFRFAYPLILYFGILVWMLLGYYFLYKKRGVVFVYPLSSVVLAAGFLSGNYKTMIPKCLRLLAVLSLLFLAARPQWVDVRSNFNVDNIDIFIVLDVSHSMSLIDDLRDARRRIVVAREEALSFIKKRLSDRIGFGVFATHSLTLAPITDDKVFLQNVVGGVEIGVIPGDSTAVGKGFVMGVSKLRDSVVKSKVVVLLTDGQSTVTDDYPIDKAISFAKELGIKVYTVGIGSLQPYMVNQYGQASRVDASQCNFDSKVLAKIAEQTGGKYFEARNPREMAQAYKHIDQLEKTPQHADIFTKFQEMFWLFFILALVSLSLEMGLSAFLWKCLG
jgi:Ca-activated chloride channel family protein